MRLKICFLSLLNPHDHKSWSGIPFQLFTHVSQFHEVIWINAQILPAWKRKLLLLQSKIHYILHWKFTYHNILYARLLAGTVRKKIVKGKFDFVLLGAGESPLIAYLKVKAPIIYVADTTFANMVDYYPWHSNLSVSALIQGNKVEENAIQNAFHLMFSSEWAANSAVNKYGASPEKVSVVSFGPNLNKIPSMKEIFSKEPAPVCRLLFLGVNWLRKGGNIAYDTFKNLQEMGVACTLTIVGCNPQLNDCNNITIIPFLDKNNVDDFNTLYNLLYNSDILLLPTRADCTPIVFSEAAAFGLPVITTNTGGVSSVIKNGINGYALPFTAGWHDYSKVIRELWTDKEKYRKMILSSRNEYENRLNWDIWSSSFNNLLEKSIKAAL